METIFSDKSISDFDKLVSAIAYIDALKKQVVKVSDSLIEANNTNSQLRTNVKDLVKANNDLSTELLNARLQPSKGDRYAFKRDAEITTLRTTIVKLNCEIKRISHNNDTLINQYQVLVAKYEALTKPNLFKRLFG